jgi:hypothetical protein
MKGVATMLAVALSASLVSESVCAEPLTKDVLADIRANNAVSKLYLRGLSDGFAWANISSAHDGNPKLFCQPETIALTIEQLIDIFKRFSKENPNFDNSSAGMVLLFALKEAFPCKS